MQVLKEQIKKLKELGFNVDYRENEDIIIVKKANWHYTFLIANNKLVTFNGKIDFKNLVRRVLIEYKNEYKENLKRFHLNLFGKEIADKIRITENMRYQVKTDFATFIFKGLKLLDIKDIRDYNKVTKVLNNYENALRTFKD